MLESSTCILIIDSNCDTLLSFAMIWVKVKIPIPKLVVMIYRLSFLWPLKRTVHFFCRADNFALPFIVSDCSRSLITRFSASPPILYKIPRLFRLRVSAFGVHEMLLH